jgi:hypothetical protein
MYTSAAGCVNVTSARRRYLLVSTYMVLLATWCVVGPHVVELIQTLLLQEADVPEQLHSPAERCVAVFLNVPAALEDCATVHVLDVSCLYQLSGTEGMQHCDRERWHSAQRFTLHMENVHLYIKQVPRLQTIPGGQQAPRPVVACAVDTRLLAVPALLQLRAFISVEPLEHTAKPVGGHLQALCICMSHICVMAVTTALSHINIKARHCHRGPPHTHRTTPTAVIMCGTARLMLQTRTL